MALASVILSSLAVLVALGTLWIALRQLRKAREQLDAARRSNELSEEALTAYTKQRNVDALVNLLLTLRNYYDTPSVSQAPRTVEAIEREQAKVLVATARASPCLPDDSKDAIKVMLVERPGTFTQHAARKALGMVTTALAAEADAPWLADPGDKGEALLEFLGLDLKDDEE